VTNNVRGRVIHREEPVGLASPSTMALGGPQAPENYRLSEDRARKGPGDVKLRRTKTLTIVIKRRGKWSIGKQGTRFRTFGEHDLVRDPSESLPGLCLESGRE